MPGLRSVTLLLALASAHARGKRAVEHGGRRTGFHERAGGRERRAFREPFLATNDAVDSLVRKRCYRSVWFTIDTGDWEEGMTADRIVERTFFTKGKPREIAPGSILIFHGSQPENLVALPAVIRGFRERGLGILPLGEALRRESPSNR